MYRQKIFLPERSALHKNRHELAVVLFTESKMIEAGHMVGETYRFYRVEPARGHAGGRQAAVKLGVWDDGTRHEMVWHTL